MNKLLGLVFFGIVFGAAAFAFSPRPVPVYPATAVSASRVMLLGVAAADRRVIAVGERGVIVVSDDEGAAGVLRRRPPKPRSPPSISSTPGAASPSATTR